MKDQLKERILSNEDIFSEIIGQQPVKRQIKSALLAERHIVLVGPPGIGKTTLAKSVSKLIPLKEGKETFIRVQGSPDLTAEDLLGDIDPIKALKFGPLSPEAFTPGKIFKANDGILFFDEINRCPEKLQNALLQVLEEGKATIATYDVDLDADFILIATMNPEDSSTEPLSDVFLDRFDLIYMRYPENLENEMRIVRKSGLSMTDFPDDLLQITVNFVRLLRQKKELEKHPSVRATIGLYERAQTNAKLSGRDKVIFEDVHESVNSVLAHRIRLAPSVKYLKTPEEFIAKEFDSYYEQNKAAIERLGDGL